MYDARFLMENGSTASHIFNHAHGLVLRHKDITPFSVPAVVLFLLKSFIVLFSVSWQCVVSANTCSSPETFTPACHVHTIFYQTETTASEEVGVTLGRRRRDSSSGGLLVPS